MDFINKNDLISELAEPMITDDMSMEETKLRLMMICYMAKNSKVEYTITNQIELLQALIEDNKDDEDFSNVIEDDEKARIIDLIVVDRL
jgi:hypothetical protein